MSIMTFKPYIHGFYHNLAEGRLMGQKCDQCGTYRLFHVPVCDTCQSLSYSEEELIRTGQLLQLTSSYKPGWRFAPYAPLACGVVQLEQGPVLFTIVEGINLENLAEEIQRLPLDVNIEIREMGGNPIPIAVVPL